MMEQCKEEVQDRSTSWPRWNRCQKKAVKDGYCTIHHPDYVAKKREEAEAKYEANRQILIRVTEYDDLQSKISRLESLLMRVINPKTAYDDYDALYPDIERELGIR